MVPSPPIADELIHKSIVHAVQNVCSTMIKQDASFVEKTAEPDNTKFTQSTTTSTA